MVFGLNEDAESLSRYQSESRSNSSSITFCATRPFLYPRLSKGKAHIGHGLALWTKMLCVELVLCLTRIAMFFFEFESGRYLLRYGKTSRHSSFLPWRMRPAPAKSGDYHMQLLQYMDSHPQHNNNPCPLPPQHICLTNTLQEDIHQEMSISSSCKRCLFLKLYDKMRTIPAKIIEDQKRCKNKIFESWSRCQHSVRSQCSNPTSYWKTNLTKTLFLFWRTDRGTSDMLYSWSWIGSQRPQHYTKFPEVHTRLTVLLWTSIFAIQIRKTGSNQVFSITGTTLYHSVTRTTPNDLNAVCRLGLQSDPLPLVGWTLTLFIGHWMQNARLKVLTSLPI